MHGFEVQKDRRPLYILVKEKLHEWVEKEVFKPGRKLPRETEMARMMNVSRATLREAISVARQEGWITQIHGVGTFVSQGTAAEKGLEILESIDSLSFRRGWKCETADLAIDERQFEQNVIQKLHLAENTRGIFVSRVKVINGVRAAYIEDFIPSGVISLGDLRDKFAGSVLDVLSLRSKPKIDYAWTNIYCIITDERLSKLLEVAPFTSLLVAEEILYDTEGQPFEYSLNFMLSTFFNFHIIRTFAS